MDVIRYILLQKEAEEQIEGEHDVIVYHIGLLKEAGLVTAVTRNDARGIIADAKIMTITWAGHDFIDAMRDDTIWNKAKEKFIKPGASWTVSILFEWLKQELRRKMLGDDAPVG